MFPFTLAGPGFLLFYLAFAVVVLAVYAYAVRSARGAHDAPSVSELTADPYAIAWVRDGEDEAVRVAVFNLVDRGLLQVQGKSVVTSPKACVDYVRRPLDRAILQACATPREAKDVNRAAPVVIACATYRQILARKGLIPGATGKQAHRMGQALVLLLLGGVAIARIVQALSRGQTNLVFLVALTAIACFIGWRLGRRRMTAAGKQALDSLRTLMQRHQRQPERLRPGGATNEALLFAAVYGIQALPSAFPLAGRLFPKRRGGGSSSGSGSGSGCGSSCSSGGSSCGGGGGGCGGCGG